MLVRTVLVVLITVLASSLWAAPPIGESDAAASSRSVDNDTYINANMILMFVTNHGNFGRDLSGVFGYDYGTFYPYTSVADIESGANTTSPQYAAGFWLGGMVDGEVRVTVTEYSSEYVPGPMAGAGPLPDDPSYRVYKLYSDSLAGNPNDDYLNWPATQGAPVDAPGQPLMLGDQMTWAVFNDADPDQHGNNNGETEPLGIEVRQWTFAGSYPTGSDIYLITQLRNRGSQTLEDFYITLWVDPDLGGAADDFVGCDSLQSLGFVYNADNDDMHYGTTPPSLGYDLLQGPLVETGNPADIGRMWGESYSGYINLPMTAFSKYINGTDPDNATESYNYMRGLNRDGSPYINPWNGMVTTYMHSGNPVTGTGDLDYDPADRRFMVTTGPITFAPGDSTEIVAAMVIGRGTDRLSSISMMRSHDDLVQDYYDTWQDYYPPQPALIAPMQPDTLYRFWVNAVDPIPATVTVGWSDQHMALKEIDPTSILISDIPIFDAVTTVGGAPGFTGNAVEITFPVKDFILNQGLTFDYRPIRYYVTGNYTDGEPFGVEASVILGGHVSGDVTGDGSLDISDVVYLVNYMYQDGPPPAILQSADVNASGGPIDISDLIYLVNYMWQGGPPPDCNY